MNEIHNRNAKSMLNVLVCEPFAYISLQQNNNFNTVFCNLINNIYCSNLIINGVIKIALISSCTYCTKNINY